MTVSVRPVKISRRPWFRTGETVLRFARFTPLLAAAIVAGCVGNTSGSRDLASVLTPVEADKSSKNGQLETGISLNKTDAKAAAGIVKPKTSETKTSDVKTALAPSQDEKSEAVKATEAVAAKPATPGAKPKPRPGSAPAAETGTANKTSAEVKPASEPAGKPADKQGSFFSRLFASNEKSSARQRAGAGSPKKAKPSLVVSRQGSNSRNRGSSLPGVRTKSIFGIDDEVEVEEFDQPVQVASVSNLARRGTHGLLLQRPDVKVGCFPRKLVGILKQVERRFGRTPIVTSGYRSPRYNRLVRGARKSTHIRCLAADIQVKGVSKWKLAKFLRSLPSRGGVGTYCHTKSVHIDISTKRAWHHCRRKRRRRA